MQPFATPAVANALLQSLAVAALFGLVGVGYWRWTAGRATGRPRRLGAAAGGVGLTGVGVVGVAMTLHSVGLRVDVLPPDGQRLTLLERVGLGVPWLAIALVMAALTVAGVLTAVGLEAYSAYAARSG
jgi:hypothetical protein